LRDVRQTLKQKPSMNWARVGYERLEKAWQQCGLLGFVWQEEDGLSALQKGLQHRRPPTLRSMLLHGQK
jgi:hypothetical protein